MTKIKQFIISTALSYFNHDGIGNNEIKENKNLNLFVEDSHCLLLYTFSQQQTIIFQTNIPLKNEKCLVFFKNQPTSLDADEHFIHLYFMVLNNNPIETFYLSLHHVYGPLLQTDDYLIRNPKLQEILLQLEANLQILSRGTDGEPSLLVISSVDDELQYWKTIAEESKTHKQKEMAEAFISIFNTLSQEISFLDAESPLEMKDILESISGLIDDLWRHSNFLYPQKRMIHLLDIIGNTCVIKLSNILIDIDVWSHDPNILSKLIECSEITNVWLNTCSAFTQNFWPNHSLHIWEGSPYTSQYVKKFHDRLTEVIEIKSLYFQLTKLLSNTERNELNTSKMFDSFKGINVWNCSMQNNALWIKSKVMFEKLIKPAENKISEKLKSKLKTSSTNQMLYEFTKYAALIERPNIHSILQKERQFLMSSLSGMLNEIENNIKTETSITNDDFAAPEISLLIQQIQKTKMMEGRVAEMENIIKNLLFDFDGSNYLLENVNSVIKNIHSYQTILYEDWTRSLQVDLNNKSIILSPDTPVIQFSGEKKFMNVTFNPRLIALERDVRHMSILGFSIPSNIKEAINYAAKFMEQARALQQVASFHNTQSERMIASQRPMMLEAAVQLATLVKEQKTVAWKDVEIVSNYVLKLKTAVDVLIKQNSFLTSQHILMRNIILSLMNTNLLLKQEEWMRSIRYMKEIVDKVESNGYTNTESWIKHWNIQLYKALEHQYRTVLIDPLSHLPTIKSELIFRQKNIHLQPPLEEIRAMSYKYLKKLIVIPSRFKGIQTQSVESENMFKSIISRNSWLMAGALEDIEITLNKVAEIMKQWKIWAALGSADLDSLCEIHLIHSSDWETNFRECKAFGQAIAKLSMDDEKIGWILISSTSLRNDLESHNRRYWLSLTTSLQSSLHRDSVTLESYALLVQNTVNQSIPKSAKELGDLSEEFRKIKEKEQQMLVLFEELHWKQNMVKAWSGEGIFSFDNLSKKWENVKFLLQKQEKILVHQAELVKMSLGSEWSNLTVSADTWYTRWIQNKPKIDQLVNISLSELENKYNIFKEANENWENFKINKENILNESQKFNHSLESQPIWEKIEETMQTDNNLWNPFKQFNEELHVLKSQEWSVFQKKLYLLDEFILEWKNKLEPFTPITLFIQKIINQYKETLPCLKHLRSKDFRERHWREICSILEINNESPENLTLNDLLNVAENIKEKSTQLQKIWHDASNEAIVREAITELELWFAGAKLIVIKHCDSKGQQIPIIKDFQQILTKIEEYQNLAGSARSTSNLQDSNSNDQLSIWESRLSHLKNILTSLAHIQRNEPYGLIPVDRITK